jgi:hypothetical protein
MDIFRFIKGGGRKKKPVGNCNWGDWKKLLGGHRREWKYNITIATVCVCVCLWTGEPVLCSWYPGGYVVDGAGFEFLQAIDFLFKHPDLLSGQLSLPFSGYQGSLLEIQQPGHSVNHSYLVPELGMMKLYLYSTHGVDRDNIHMVQNRDQ